MRHPASDPDPDRAGPAPPRPLAATILPARPEPGLYLVATPIGAARDITLRALDVLNGADLLAAEDTRVLRQLMEIHGVPLRGRRIVTYHDHNADRQRPAILRALHDGKSVAYASDAGTPLVADPGYRLARDVAGAGMRVHALPGASAMLAALTVSGLPSDRFMFVGFPPAAAGAKRRWIASWSGVDATVIAFESPRRLRQLLRDMPPEQAMREVVICRELTKKFEEVIRGRVATLAQELPEEGLRGEVVMVFGRPEAREPGEDDIRAALLTELQESSVKDAATAVSSRMGLARRDVYAMALRIMKEDR